MSETVASNEGIGYLHDVGRLVDADAAGVRRAWSSIGVMAMAMYELFAVLERRMTGWAHRGSHANG